MMCNKTVLFKTRKRQGDRNHRKSNLNLSGQHGSLWAEMVRGDGFRESPEWVSWLNMLNIGQGLIRSISIFSEAFRRGKTSCKAEQRLPQIHSTKAEMEPTIRLDSQLRVDFSIAGCARAKKDIFMISLMFSRQFVHEFFVLQDSSSCQACGA